MRHQFRAQDLVVYQKRKHGNHPSLRAHDVRPTPSGDAYDYVVDKYWTVVQTLDDGKLIVRTPRGKTHELDSSDPCLRPPTLRERVRLLLLKRERLRAAGARSD